MTPVPEISIVVPLYNEEDNIAPLCASITDVMTRWGRSFEVLLVDDGSTDNTATRVEAEVARDSRLRFLRMNFNAGQTPALVAGFEAARGVIVISMDGDHQNDPADIPRLVERLDNGVDVVCGWRKRRRDSWLWRTLPSALANRLVASITGVRIHDTGCTLRAYRGEVVRALTMYSDMHRFLPALTSMTGARVEEIEVNHRPRRHGGSKYGINRTFQVLVDVATIGMLVRFGATPGRWFGALSVPPFVVGVLSVWLALRPTAIEGGNVVLWSLTTMMLYLVASLISLGVLAETVLFYSNRRSLRKLPLALVASADVDPPRSGRRGA
jgi:glycosyltransferase involved in cell wall biosynthesis